jgi:hypothetical protein
MSSVMRLNRSQRSPMPRTHETPDSNPSRVSSLMNPATVMFNQVTEKHELYFSSIYCQYVSAAGGCARMNFT